MYDALRDRARQMRPIEPGIPHPGLWSSNKIPKKPKVVSKDATTGFVKKRTKFSDQFSVVLLTAKFEKPKVSRTASKFSSDASAILYFKDCSVVNVIKLPCFLPSISSTIMVSPSITR